MEISDIIMETFTLGTAIGLNMTHNASFCAESVNAAAWNIAIHSPNWPYIAKHSPT